MIKESTTLQEFFGLHNKRLEAPYCSVVRCDTQSPGRVGDDHEEPANLLLTEEKEETSAMSRVIKFFNKKLY